MDEKALRNEIIDRCREMNAAGINQGSSGNISARCGDGFLISPSAIPYDHLEPEMIVAMQFDGSWEGSFKPSSEWRFHLDILKARPDLNAVVHAHPPHCTALAIRGMEIPPVHYMVAVAGGDTIRCAPYATFGSQELSDHAVAALDERMACLLANHGMIACGSNLAHALWLAVEVEALARQYLLALQTGEPIRLTSQQMDEVLEKFGSYVKKG
jgi:L-fuculose-phosphate aldolase